MRAPQVVGVGQEADVLTKLKACGDAVEGDVSVISHEEVLTGDTPTLVKARTTNV
jgi:hypothetical protein